MSIIEKLGISINPWVLDEDCEGRDIIRGGDKELLLELPFTSSEDDLLITSAPEILEALINSTIIMAENLNGWGYVNDRNRDIIEKSTGKTWEEIKELINDN